MSIKYSQQEPSPLIWSPVTGMYDEKLASISGKEYTPDMSFYACHHGNYLIFGYIKVEEKLFPVFCRHYGGGILSEIEQIAYGKATGSAYIYEGVWANEARSAYKVIQRPNLVYMDWSAIYEPCSPFTLPQPDWNNLEKGKIYPGNRPLPWPTYKIQDKSVENPIWGTVTTINKYEVNAPVFRDNPPILRGNDAKILGEKQGWPLLSAYLYMEPFGPNGCVKIAHAYFPK